MFEITMEMIIFVKKRKKKTEGRRKKLSLTLKKLRIAFSNILPLYVTFFFTICVGS